MIEISTVHNVYDLSLTEKSTSSRILWKGNTHLLHQFSDFIRPVPNLYLFYIYNISSLIKSIEIGHRNVY